MFGKSSRQKQAELFKSLLVQQRKPQHSPHLLAQVPSWKKLEEDFTPLYSSAGLSSHSIRKLVIMPGKEAHVNTCALREHKLLCKCCLALEAIISHLKSNYRPGWNHLKGSLGERTNALLAGVGGNLMRLVGERTGSFLAILLRAFSQLGFHRKLHLAADLLLRRLIC